jgi:hypothetical protein
MAKDYYQILGVSSTAHATDIKRAYRKLALLYHPDKNPDPSAEFHIKEINEAYDVLSDVESRQAYDFKRENPFRDILETPQKPQHRDPAYHRRRPTQKRKSERETLFEMMTEYYRPARWVLLGSAVFCFFLMMDFVIPYKRTTDKLVEIRRTKEITYRGHQSGKNEFTTDVLYFAGDRSVKIENNAEGHFKVGHAVAIRNTSLLDIGIDVVASDGYVAPVAVTIYSSFVFGPVALFLVTLVGLWRPKNIELTFNTGVASFIVLILNFIFILIS